MKSPAFQFYPKDWLSDLRVGLMSLEAKGAYLQLLCHQWLEQGPIPGDMRSLSFMCGCSVRKMRTLWPSIAPCFDSVGDDLIENSRLSQARVERELFLEKSSHGGKLSAEKRAATRVREAKGASQLVETPLVAKSNSASASASPSTEPDIPVVPSVDSRVPAVRTGRFHAINAINALWKSLPCLSEPNGYDWAVGGMRLSAIFSDWTTAEIKDILVKINENPEGCGWAGKGGPAHLADLISDKSKTVIQAVKDRDPDSTKDDKATTIEEINAVRAKLGVRPYGQ